MAATGYGTQVFVTPATAPSVYQHPEYLALIETIRTDPADDAPRLILSDWLEEHGEDERAEFIRVQVALAALGKHPKCHCHFGAFNEGGCPRDIAQRLREREQELAGQSGGPCLRCDWHAPLEHGGMQWEYSRGFVSEIRLTCAAFMGGRCGRCGGAERVEGYGGTVTMPCPACRGKGRVEGLAGALFAAHPIERVVLTDKRPWGLYHSDTNRGSSGWNPRGDHDGPTQLPPELYALLPRSADYISAPIYRHEKEALDTLSATLVAYGRLLVGLPPLSKPMPV